MFHARCVFLCAAAAFTLAPLAAQAESPGCDCSASSVTATVVEALECVVTQDTLDVCYGNDAVITVTNNCAFDVVVSGVEDVGGESTPDTTIAAGETGTWQQAFTPTLGYEGDTTVSMTWPLEADGVSHSLELTFTGACVEVEEGEPGGCQGGSAPTAGWLMALALAALMVSRRRASQAH